MVNCDLVVIDINLNIQCISKSNIIDNHLFVIKFKPNSEFRLLIGTCHRENTNPVWSHSQLFA